MEHAKAMEIASAIYERLYPVCERISVAGSLRRGKAEVKDIEIVMAPRVNITSTLFGEISTQADIDTTGLGRHIKNGPKYKQIALPEGINLDLFVVTHPAQWGVIFALRTGPAELSKKLVTIKRFGGFLPSWAKVKDGAVWVKREIVPMPEEEDFFKFCGLPYLKPEHRAAFLERSWLSMKSRQP